MRILLLLPLAAALLSAESFNLTVQVSGFKSDKGTAEFGLFNDASAYPTKPERAFAAQRGKISNGATTVEFKGLPKGTYAIAAYHDVNGNRKLDANFIGIPKEPIGASNNAKGRMGPPSFKDAQFPLTADLTIQFTMQ